MGFLTSILHSRTNKAARDAFLKIVNERSEIAIICGGPSLNSAAIQSIKNSNVFFINHTVDLIDQLDDSNKFFWFSADADRVNECSEKCKQAQTRIVAIHDYGNYRRVRSDIGSDAVFLLPRINRRALVTRLNAAAEQVSENDQLRLPNIRNNLRISYILGGTSLLPIFALALSLSPRIVAIHGFDATESNVTYAEGMKLPAGAKSSLGFNRQRIGKMLQKIVDEARSIGIRGKVQNYSPHTQDILKSS